MMNPELESEERRKKTRYIGRHLAINFPVVSDSHSAAISVSADSEAPPILVAGGE